MSTAASARDKSCDAPGYECHIIVDASTGGMPARTSPARSHRHAMTAGRVVDRVLHEVERASDELVGFAADLAFRRSTLPVSSARDCAHVIGARLASLGHDVEYFAAEGRPEHTARFPRINVVGTRRGLGSRPTVHLNGHFDIVPTGDSWTVDPFGGVVRDGKLYGRGSCDMKAGIAAAVYAVELSGAPASLPGTVEVGGTVDEESGGFAGVGVARRTGASVAFTHRFLHHSRTTECRPHLRRPSRRYWFGWRPAGRSVTAACRSSVRAPLRR